MSHYSEQNEQYNKEQNAPKKTVLDAVDYFKANICEYDRPVDDSSGDLFIYESRATGLFSSKVIESGFKLVCTIEEFNQCTDDLAAYANKESRSKLKEKTEKAAKNLRSLVNDWKDSEQSKDEASENLLNAVYAQSIEQDEQGNVKITEPLPFVGFSKSLDDLKNIMKTVNERMKGMNEQLKYTSDIAITHKQPEANMLCRVEFACPDMGLMVVDFTFKFENETQYVGLDKYGFAMVIEHSEFIAFHAVDERSEMDVAKEKQVDLFYTKVHSKDNWHHITKDQLRFMQEKGMLAEIILPPEK